jgi:hypothetical protein
MKITRRQLRKLIYEAIQDERVDESLFGFLGGMFGGKKPYNQLSPKEINKLCREWYLIVNTPHRVNLLGYSTGEAVQDRRQWLNSNVSEDPLQIQKFLTSYKSWLKSSDFTEFQKTPEYARAIDKRKEDFQKYLKESKDHKEIKMKDVEKAVRKCLEKEGGAAGMGLLVKCVKGLQTKTKKLPKHCKTNKQIAKCILKMDFVVKHRYEDIILTVGLPKRK